MKLHWMLAIAMVTAGVLVPSVAQAGYPFNPAFNCSKYSDGTGSCWGTLAGARQNADPYAEAYFADYVESGVPEVRYFYAYLNNVSYTCGASTAVIPLWSAAVADHGLFEVDWNASGACTFLEVAGWSTYYY